VVLERKNSHGKYVGDRKTLGGSHGGGERNEIYFKYRSTNHKLRERDPFGKKRKRATTGTNVGKWREKGGGYYS